LRLISRVVNTLTFVNSRFTNVNHFMGDVSPPHPMPKAAKEKQPPENGLREHQNVTLGRAETATPPGHHHGADRGSPPGRRPGNRDRKGQPKGTDRGADQGRNRPGGKASGSAAGKQPGAKMQPMPRMMVWIEKPNLAGWGCSDCAWFFRPSEPPTEPSFEAMKQQFEAQRDKEFDRYVCAAHPKARDRQARRSSPGSETQTGG
jgi:rubredoxin